MHTNGRYIQIGSMVRAYDISTAPVNRFLKAGTIKYTRECRAYKGNKLPQFVDIPVKWRPFGQQEQHRPEKYKKEPNTIPVKISVYPL
jgi:hypothetical protein